MLIKLEPVNVVGERAVHVFEHATNGRVEVEATVEEYDALADGTRPELEDAVWLFSYKDWKFDTVDGKLGDSQYAIDPNGKYVVKVEGVQATEDELINEEIDKEAFLEKETYDIKPLPPDPPLLGEII